MTQRQDTAGSRKERPARKWPEARDPVAATGQPSRDVPAKMDGHVASVRYGDEHELRVLPALHAKTAEDDATHDATRHDDSETDPEAHADLDRITTQRARRHQDEGPVTARFCAPGRAHAECQGRTVARRK